MTHVQTMGPQMARILVSQTGLKKKKKEMTSSFGILCVDMSKDCFAFRNIVSAL